MQATGKAVKCEIICQQGNGSSLWLCGTGDARCVRGTARKPSRSASVDLSTRMESLDVLRVLGGQETSVCGREKLRVAEAVVLAKCAAVSGGRRGSRISRSGRSAGAGRSTVSSPDRADTGWVPWISNFSTRLARSASAASRCAGDPDGNGGRRRYRRRVELRQLDALAGAALDPKGAGARGGRMGRSRAARAGGGVTGLAKTPTEENLLPSARVEAWSRFACRPAAKAPAVTGPSPA